MVSRRAYFLVTAAVGTLLLSTFLGVLVRRGVDLGGIVLIGLAILTGWLRLRVEPSLHMTLTPLVVFIGILSGSGEIAILASGISSVVSSRIFAKRSLDVTLEEMGEETIAAALAFLAFKGGGLTSTALSPVEAVLRFLLAATVFIVAKLILASIRLRLTEGLGLRSFAWGPGRQITLHLFALSLASLGLSYLASAYSDVRYLIVALATVAIVEFYHPWRLLSEQNDVLFANLAMIAQAIDLKDPYTARHSRNVSKIAARLARAIRLSEDEVKKIRIGALLHDIGKIGISGRVIRKPARLDPDEAALMKQHSVISAEIMQPIDLLAESATMVRHHHEHYDGSGYPDGLSGEDIPIGSRVVLVADAFDAMTTDRPYRRGRSKEEALRVLKEHAGKQFDPRMVEALDSIIDLI